MYGIVYALFTCYSAAYTVKFVVFLGTKEAKTSQKVLHLVQQALNGMYTYIHMQTQVHTITDRIVEVQTLMFRFRPLTITHFNTIVLTFHNWFRWTGMRKCIDESASHTILLLHRSVKLSFIMRFIACGLNGMILSFNHLMYFRLPKSVFMYGGRGTNKILI